MRSVKIFNNNAVSVLMPGGKDAVALGNGIGFNKRPGDEIDERKIQKIYYVQTEMQQKFLQMLEDVEPNVLEAAEEIIELVSADGLSISSKATISLIDHISFAIERSRSGDILPNMLLEETKLLYQKEFALGLKALDIIEKHCAVRLPEDEAGYIALHLITIWIDRDAAYDGLKFVSGAMSIIKQTYGLQLDDSLDMMRLATHLKFLAMRIFQKTELNSDGVEDLYLQLLQKDPRNVQCLERLDEYSTRTFHYSLGRQEKFYLLIHLNKILQGSAERK